MVSDLEYKKALTFTSTSNLQRGLNYKLVIKTRLKWLLLLQSGQIP